MLALKKSLAIVCKPLQSAHESGGLLHLCSANRRTVPFIVHGDVRPVSGIWAPPEGHLCRPDWICYLFIRMNRRERIPRQFSVRPRTRRSGMESFSRETALGLGASLRVGHLRGSLKASGWALHRCKPRERGFECDGVGVEGQAGMWLEEGAGSIYRPEASAAELPAASAVGFLPGWFQTHSRLSTCTLEHATSYKHWKRHFSERNEKTWEPQKADMIW